MAIVRLKNDHNNLANVPDSDAWVKAHPEYEAIDESQVPKVIGTDEANRQAINSANSPGTSSVVNLDNGWTMQIEAGNPASDIMLSNKDGKNLTYSQSKHAFVNNFTGETIQLEGNDGWNKSSVADFKAYIDKSAGDFYTTNKENLRLSDQSWMEKYKGDINYQPVTDLNNQYTPELMNRYAESLADPFKTATENAVGALNSRGMYGSGYQQEQIGRAQSAYDTGVGAEGSKLTSDYYKNALTNAEQTYKNSVDAYTATLQDLFKKSGKDADTFWSEMQGNITAELQRYADQRTADVGTVTTQYGLDAQALQDRLDNTRALFSEVGNIAGKTIPLSQSVNTGQANTTSSGNFYQGSTLTSNARNAVSTSSDEYFNNPL